jgi:xylulokinase
MFLGIDLGTTSMKGLVTDQNGVVKGVYQKPVTLLSPDILSREQNPIEWKNALEAILEEISEHFQIEAIGFSGQMHSLVMLDRYDQPIRNSILWCDQRTSQECAEATRSLGGEKEVVRRIGNPILEGFTLPKLLWVKKHEPEYYERLRMVLLPKDYLSFILCGEKGIDMSDASGTAFYNVFDRTWDGQLLSLLGLNTSYLPKVTSSTSVRGLLRKEYARRLGWNNVKIVSGGADNAVAAFGVGMQRNGDGMVSIGTSGTVAVATDRKTGDEEGKIHYFNHVLPDMSFYMGVMLSATNSLDWFAENAGQAINWETLEKEVRSSESGAKGILFLPYLNGERTPHRDPLAKGVLFGLTSYHTRGDLYRAILEGISYGLRDSFELISAKTPVCRLRIVGGAAKNEIWREIIATNFNIPLELPEIDQGGSYGAAMLAAMGSGVAIDDVVKWVRIKRIIEPNQDWIERYRLGYEGYKELYTRLKSMFSEYPRMLKF